MKLNADIARIGWMIVAVVLVASGIQHMISQEIYPRIRGLGQPPSVEGWPVFYLGAGELALGVLVFVIVYRWGRH